MNTVLLISYDEATLTQTQISSTNLLSVDNIYPSIVFDVDIGSFANKYFHQKKPPTFSCHVQGSHLMGKEETTKLSQKS